MSKITTAKALLNRSARKSAPLSAGQKAAATKARIKMERIAAEQAAIAAYQAMTPGQKAAHTKRNQAATAAPVATPAPVAPVPVATPAPALAYADMTAGQKAAYTKRLGKPGSAATPAPVAAAPAAPVAADPAPVAPVGAAETLARLLALAPVLKAAGLI